MFSFLGLKEPVDYMREQLQKIDIEPADDLPTVKKQYMTHVINPIIVQFPVDGPLVVSFLTSEVDGESGLGQTEYPTVTETIKYQNFMQLMQYREIFDRTFEGNSINNLVINEKTIVTVRDRDKLIRFLVDNPQDANELYDLVITLDKKFVSKTMWRMDSKQRLKDKSNYFEREEKYHDGLPGEEELVLESPVLPSVTPPNDHGRKAIYIAATVLGSSLIIAGAAAFVASGAGPALVVGAFLMAVGKAVLTGFAALGIGAQVAVGVTAISGAGLLSFGLYGLCKKTPSPAQDRVELLPADNGRSVQAI